MSNIFLNEEEIRTVIRKRMLKEAVDGKEVVKDVATGAAAGLGTVAALGAAAGVSTTVAGVVGGASSVAVGGAVGGGMLAGGVGSTAATIAGVNIWNPVGWTIIVGAAVGTTLYFILSKADGNEVVEQVLSFPGGNLVDEIENELKTLEAMLRKKDAELIPASGLAHEYISDSDTNDYVERLYAATKGAFFGTGMGTDETAIQEVFNDIPTLLDVAKVSKFFQEDYSDSWTFDSNLYNVMKNELSNSDFNKFVTRPLNPKNKPVIKLGGNLFTIDELKQWNGEIEKLKNQKVPDEDVVVIDPGSLKGNNVKKIQNIMNLYSGRESLGIVITEDGSWGPKTDKLWNRFLNHVTINHSVFKTDEVFSSFKEGVHKWDSVSGTSILKYPGYTPNTVGCLGFVVDGYNGNVDYGSGKKKISGGGGGGGGSKIKKQKVSGGEPDIKAATRSGGGLVPEVRVTLAGPGKNTLESVGFPARTSERLASTISTRVKGTITGGVINLTVVVNRNGTVNNVRIAPGQRRNPINKQFENLKNVVRRFLEKAGNANNELITPSRARVNFRQKTRKFELVLDFPAGTYN